MRRSGADIKTTMWSWFIIVGVQTPQWSGDDLKENSTSTCVHKLSFFFLFHGLLNPTNGKGKKKHTSTSL